MARITIISPEGRLERELFAHNTLGRHPDNTHQVLDRIVSKVHCHIDYIDGRYVLQDLESLNGTYVNGERAGRHVLNNGDEIMMGSTRIYFESGGAGSTSIGPGAGPGLVTAPSTPASMGAAAQNAASPTVPGAATATGPATPLKPFEQTPYVAPAAFGATGAAISAPKPSSKVTIAPGMVESHIRTKLTALEQQNFLPEKMLTDVDALRRDYEKLRASYEVTRAIAGEFDIDALLNKILDSAFTLLAADRGVVLMYDDNHELKPRCVRTKKAQAQGEEVVLSTTIIDQVVNNKVAVLSSDASLDARFNSAKSIIMQGIRSSMGVPLLSNGEVFGLMMLDSQVAANAFTDKDLHLFQNIANQAAVALQNTLYAKKLEKEAVTRERFQRLLSPAIAEQVINGSVEVKKYGEVRQTTVLFTDIRGFTSMSEKTDAREVVDMLNEYFELMVEIIFANEGTLDKFVGDEIMALYGAPVSYPDDPYRAVKTAYEMLQALADFNSQREAVGKQPVYIGVGVNTGEVVAGYLGSSRALEYTVIGDAVNAGARLCSHAKAGQIVISEVTWEAIRDYFDVEELPPAQVKGKEKALRVFNVLKPNGNKPERVSEPA
jgi:adenylate cyclase